MIIRKKSTQDQTIKGTKATSAPKKSAVIKKESRIFDEKPVIEKPDLKIETPKIQEEEPFEKIDISSIEFKERIERRRGDRRRGYRRIDERSLVTRAQQEAHTIKELASKEGYQNGLKEAQGELQELKSALSEFLNQKDEMYEEFYPHVVEIALSAAKKIIKKEVELSPQILKEIVLSTLDELNSDTQRVEVKVNPVDVEFAKASLPEAIQTKLDNVKLTIIQDDTIEQGSCIVIANNGVIDANFNTQLAVLQNAFGIYKGGL